MVKKRIVDIVEELVLSFIHENGLELIDIEFLKEGKDWFLRVFIDKENGVTLDDCQMVSEFLSDKLDETDPIEQGYYLEVSSPGLDRPLKTEKDYRRNLGKFIEVSLYQAVNGKKAFEGRLKEFNEKSITIQMDENQTAIIEKSNITKAKPVLTI